MPVERHLVGAGGLGDGFDADAPDAVAMEQIAGGAQDALARPRRVGSCRVGADSTGWNSIGKYLGHFASCEDLRCAARLTTVLPVGNNSLLPTGNISRQLRSRSDPFYG